MIKAAEKTLNELSRISDYFDKCIKFMQEHELSELSLGKHHISDEIHVTVEEYETQESNEKRFESHREYIDLQYVIAGSEIIEVSDIVNLRDSTPYNKEKDIIFYEDVITHKRTEKVILNADNFAVLFPEDGHKPGVICDHKQRVRKAVFKIHI